MISGVRRFSNRVRFGFAVLLVLAVALSAPLGAAAAGLGGGISSNVPALTTARATNVVARVVLSPRSPNIVLINQQITLSFFYNTTSTTGAVVTGTAMSGTTATATATNCKTAVLAVGSGTGTCMLSVGTGGVQVTGIRFQMWNAGHTALLFQATLPVNYQIRGGANLVSALILTPYAPNVILLGKGVSVKFNYKTNQAGGVRILAVPFTGTTATPNYVTCGSTVYPTGSGTGTCRFTISSGATGVNSLHIQMWNATKTKMLIQQAIPVSYRFVNAPSMIMNLTLTPVTANFQRLSANIAIHFNYQTDQAAGIVVEAVPFSGTTATANATTTASAVLPTGSGKGLCTFMINSGTVVVNRVRIQVFDSTKSTVLFTTFVPVNYQFR